MKSFLEWLSSGSPDGLLASRPFAVFVLAAVGGGYAATTRPSDRGESGRMGLPGGKLEPDESPIDAVKREAMEEGWAVDVSDEVPFHAQMVEGKIVWWYRGENAKMLKRFKEQGRVVPFVASREEVISSRFGNENLGL